LLALLIEVLRAHGEGVAAFSRRHPGDRAIRIEHEPGRQRALQRPHHLAGIEGRIAADAELGLEVIAVRGPLHRCGQCRAGKDHLHLTGEDLEGLRAVGGLVARLHLEGCIAGRCRGAGEHAIGAERKAFGQRAADERPAHRLAVEGCVSRDLQHRVEVEARVCATHQRCG